MRHLAALFCAAAVVACSGGDDGDDTPADTGTEDTSTEDTSTEDTGPQLPADPRPVTVDVSGGWTGTISFDTPTCINYPQGSLVSFRQFWRGTGHNALLVVDVIGTFAGAGTYDTANSSLRVMLQTEAASQATNYNLALSVDESQGDSAMLTVDHISDIAWGQVTLTGMHGLVDGADVGAVTVTSPLPIYCPAVTTQ